MQTPGVSRRPIGCEDTSALPVLSASGTEQEWRTDAYQGHGDQRADDKSWSGSECIRDGSEEYSPECCSEVDGGTDPTAGFRPRPRVSACVSNQIADDELRSQEDTDQGTLDKGCGSPADESHDPDDDRRNERQDQQLVFQNGPQSNSPVDRPADGTGACKKREQHAGEQCVGLRSSKCWRCDLEAAELRAPLCWRESGLVTKNVAPTVTQPAESRSAASGLMSAASKAARSGPSANVTFSATASRLKQRIRIPSAGNAADQSTRMVAPKGGVDTPARTPGTAAGAVLTHLRIRGRSGGRLVPSPAGSAARSVQADR